MDFRKYYENFHKKRETKVQWLLDDTEQKELYDDLGIIGEISSPESSSTTLSFAAKRIRDASKCGMLQNCKQLNFVTPSDTNMGINVKLKRALNRYQRKRSQQQVYCYGYHAKVGRMDVSKESNVKYMENNKSLESFTIAKLPDEVFLKIFQYCNSKTRVLCSQVCWRWYHIANDESLWQQVSLARKTVDFHQLQRLFKRGVLVLSLNCAIVEKNLSSASGNSSAISTGECSVFTSSSRIDPFSRAYHYSVHSLDFTNANISSNALCLILMRCNQLKNLSLEGLTISRNVLGSLANCSLLERLNVCLCHEMTLPDLVQLLISSQNLLELNLAWTNLCQLDPSEIIESLPSSLTRLNLSGFRSTLTDNHIITLIQRCPMLVEIDVSDSNQLTGRMVEHMVERLSSSLQAVNLSRCYSISPNYFLRFSRLPHLRYLDVFGVMDDASISTLAAALPRVRVCLRPFSAIARPSPSALYGTRRRTVWGYYVV